MTDGVSKEWTHDLGPKDDGPSPGRQGGVAAHQELRASQACPMVDPSHGKGVSRVSAGSLGAVSHAWGFKRGSVITRRPCKAFKQRNGRI